MNLSVQSLPGFFKSIEVKLKDIHPSFEEVGMLEVSLLVRQPANPAKVAMLVQSLKSALADKRISLAEVLGIFLILASE